MTATSDLAIAALRNLLPRVDARKGEIEAALRQHLDDPPPSAASLGLSLSSRFPDLEGVAASVFAGPEPTRAVGADAAATIREVAATTELADLVRSSPTLTAALASAFPHVAAPLKPPLIAVLVGDPELDEEGLPVRPGGRARWRIPWELFEDRLQEAVDTSGRDVRLDFARATWETALGVVPRADILVLLCHGNPDALAFERDQPAAFLQRRLVSVDDDLPVLFAGARPRIVLVLACHAAPAASAVVSAGVPLSMAIDAEKPLEWNDAADLATAFLTALLAGTEGRIAFKQAARATDVANEFAIFGTAPTYVLAPEGAPFVYSPGPALGSPGARLVAREKELAEVVEAADRPGLVVVHGAPGQGKTELVRAVARRWRLRNLRVPVLWANLEQATTPDAVALAVASQLAESELSDPIPGTAGAAAGRVRRLVVLDNAEDAQFGCPGAFKELVAALLAPGRASVVMTTRESPVGPWPARTLTLGPMTEMSDAVELARGVLTDILGGSAAAARLAALSEEPDINDLLQELCGHALSLRLAFALLADGTAPASVCQDLRQGKLRLGSTSADRQTSLQTSLDLSHNRLRSTHPGAPELWRIVAELPGGLPKSAALAGPDADDLRALRELALVEETAGGWECLPPVAAHLRNHLPPPDEARRRGVRRAVLDALAREMSAAAELIGTNRSADALLAFARWYRAIDDLFDDPPGRRRDLASLLHAARIAHYAGLIALGLEWCQQSALEEAEGARGAGALFVAGTLSVAAGRLDEAAERYRAALTLFEAGDQLGRANTLRALGDLAMRRSELDEAGERYGAALALLDAAGDDLGRANTLRALGDLAMRRSEPDEAGERYGAALAIFEAVGDRLGQANTLLGAGDLATRQGDPREAAERYGNALAIFEAVEDRLGQANTLKSLGDLAAWQARLDEASRHYVDALRLFEEVEDGLGQANTLKSIGDLAMRRVNPDEAAQRYAAALPLFEEVEDRLGQANTLKSLGDLAAWQARDEASQCYVDALRLFEAVKDRLGQANVLRTLADLALRQNDPEAALAYAREALGLAVAIADPMGTTAALASTGRALVALGRPDEAVPLLLQARGLAQETSTGGNEALALLDLAKALAVGGNGDAANAVTAAGAVLARRHAIPLPPPMESALDAMSAEDAERVLAEVDAFLDALTAGAPQPDTET